MEPIILKPLRDQITNVRYGKLGDILFEFRGVPYEAPEPIDLCVVGYGEAARSWALKQIIRQKATKV